ncbi:MAG: ATP-dependent 6-phosphofructokinase [Acidobacteria bacterium]|nr:ATP-dependent 6-phosphofructokinase [Acidobacteriota bacterium]
MDNQQYDFSIPTLGPARHASTLDLGEAGAADFVSEQRRVLFHSEWDDVRPYAEQALTPPALEVAGPREKLFFRASDVRAAIVTTGGLCPGINDVVRSLVLTLSWHYGVREILGIRYGLRGFVADDAPPVTLTPEAVRNIHHEGGSLLGSSRGAPPVEDIVRFLDRMAIGLLFLIGGDGTMRAAQAIAAGVRQKGLLVSVIGIPKTIDNDIPFVDRTFGFTTAVSLARVAIDAAHAEATGAYNGVGLVRLMGRSSGFIAAEAALASGEPNFVLIPEVPFEMDGPQGFLATLHRRLVSRRHAVVVVAEGAGQEFLDEERRTRGTDESGNQRLGDVGRYMRRRIDEYFRERDMAVTVKYIDPGYTIRSAPASASDAIYCQELGQNAVHAAMSGRTEMVVGLINGRQVHVPIRLVTSGIKRVKTENPLWRSVLQSTGQPVRMVNS